MDYINTKLDLAFKLKEIGDYTGAEEELIEGLNIASDNNLLLTSLADLYSRQDRLDEAFSIADQVLSREINNQRALIIKGDISLKRRKYRDAIDYFRNAIRSGENSYIYKRLIQSLMKNNQFTEALDVCHQSLIKSPQDLKILTLLARCYKKLKFYKEAKELYEKLVSKCPEDKFLYKEYIEVKSVDKPPEELVKELDSILKVSSVSGNVHLRLLLAGTHFYNPVGKAKSFKYIFCITYQFIKFFHRFLSFYDFYKFYLVKLVSSLNSSCIFAGRHFFSPKTCRIGYIINRQHFSL